MQTPHISVLLNEVLQLLDPKPEGFFIDGTTDGGGHAAAVIERIGEKGMFLGLDWDKGMVERLKETFSGKKGKIMLEYSNYAEVKEVMERLGLPKADGLLLDLGFSSTQLEQERGMSFQKDELLDMRYDLTGDLPTAADVVNGLTEEELANVIFQYGEERMSRRIAKRIVEERKRKRITTTKELADAVVGAVGRGYEKGRIHPATRVFQALRIYVNKELENLEKILSECDAIIKPGGRIAIISFHSLEDRIVKTRFREMEKTKKGRILTKKPIIATEEEIRQNPRSRSAKLRGFEIASN
ncbi:MAG: Ribosomal RNA small subunit methyltransferase H [Candidatus Wolfebacteria bacterium GW2011_GWE1_48_7]|uniref:Ribosomal RNA small subunit methyltransferase H n=2 Tax=Candidatus Wolfeibacteriota TaxID=1752735 RepID=A0A0G1U6Z4_9BACT|nr:MAG: S-adenosyl-methyltransferase MraW, 16S rRNA (cytosine1402-N4)-methyltransferase [Candidatus Wolfebacteria bacterium GW2011_GWB1_47_1]KKU36936.1 MAG: Ribosomal RNA small subunit methyltransferase H [Candidatus Wolfebacteria bacterium GW2011_GWC2_46_275]KKU42221.1 MAG: Ribosomal RNA small subunit methyltransferase H [Candidatus Wolfebacteria bacterium GW2011_GWB2_46_69]KKU53842.1 MAG: Ribosomal RNA small subunit methyltransferase H [Candidatus Wolfebacteria bacterium GW2011_GWC1_47_103]KK